ncbi:MAG: HAD family hydrolase [Acidimicrobiia bacterium]|nr:HAD family hydrolase [Acidimicrobiia bacterium]
MLLERPRAVTFDCWSTVIYETDPDAAHTRRIEIVCEAAHAAGMPVDEDLAADVLRRTWDRFDVNWEAQVAPTPHDMAGWILEFVGAPGVPVRGSLARALAVQSLERRVLPLPGVDETLRALRREGVRIGLICDTGYSPGSTLRMILARTGLLDYFEVTTFSDEMGVPKPHPFVFSRTLEGLGTAPDDAVHVGDLKRTDVAGARALGMQTVRINLHNDDDSEHPDADVVVSSHEDLLAVLGYS